MVTATIITSIVAVAGAAFSIYSYYASKQQAEEMFDRSSVQAEAQMEQVSRQSALAEERSDQKQLEAEERLNRQQRIAERARVAAIYGRDYRGRGELNTK